jgi:hypothetical protein
VLLPSTASSPPSSSMTSTRRLGLPACWRAYRITLPSASANSCPGIGDRRTWLTPHKRGQPSAQDDLTRGRLRTRPSRRTKHVADLQPFPGAKELQSPAGGGGMFDIYINQKRELLVVSNGSKPSILGQALKWRKSRKRIKSVSAEIRSAVERQGFYLRQLNLK